MGELPESFVNNNVNSQFDILVNHINSLTEKYETAAKEYFNKFDRLGFNSVRKLKTEQIKDNIALIQRWGVENVSQECSSIAEISNEMISTLNEQKYMATLRAAIAKEEEKIDKLEKAKSFLKCNLEKQRRRFKMKVEAISKIDPIVLSCQEMPLEDPPAVTSVFQRLNLDECNVIESRDALLEKEMKNVKIENEITAIEKELKKYDDLPADLCLAKNMLLQAEKESKQLEKEVQERFKANSYVS